MNGRTGQVKEEGDVSVAQDKADGEIIVYSKVDFSNDRQFYLALEILIKCFDDHRHYQSRTNEEKLVTGNPSWVNRMSADALANLRWDVTCTIEGVILKIFSNHQIRRFRNNIVEVAHALEKIIFCRASSAKEYGSRDSLLYRMKACSREYAERVARNSSELEHFVPLLRETKEQIRPVKRARGCGARAA